MWSGAVDFFTDIYLTLSYCLCINSSSMEFESPSTSINNTFNIIIGIALVFGPILVVWGLNRGWKKCQTVPTSLEGDDNKSKKAKKYRPEEEEKVVVEVVYRQGKPNTQAKTSSKNPSRPSKTEIEAKGRLAKNRFTRVLRKGVSRQQQHLEGGEPEEPMKFKRGKEPK